MKYEYKCPQCEDKFEIESSMKDTTPTYSCPVCGSESKKIIGVCMFKSPNTRNKPVKVLSKDAFTNPNWRGKGEGYI